MLRNLETELRVSQLPLRKLSFINSSAAPFAGKNLLDRLQSDSTCELLDLFSALELIRSDSERRAVGLLKSLIG